MLAYRRRWGSFMSRIAILAAVSVVALGTGTASLAAATCVTHDEMTTLRIAAFQQQLMVAALTCHDENDYNDFVRSYRPALQRSDRAMLDLFVSQDGVNGDDAYNAYKTRLANLASMRSIQHGERFCREADRQFDRALNDDRPLSELVWSEPVSAHTPFESCDEGTIMADARERPFRYLHRTRWLQPRD
jgi:hypothetical protein